MQLTVRNVSELLSVSEKTVYRWITERRLPGYRVSGQYRFNRAELLEWATGNKVQVSARILQESESELGPMPDLGEALQAGGIHYRLTGEDKGEVLRNVVEMLRLPEGVDREFLWEVLMAREALESTGVGDGIAIPHARSPIVLHVTRPMVTLCFLEKPVEFGALDGKPVHALFSLISPTVKGHLHVLSRLAFALRDAVLKAAIERQAGRDDIVAEFRRVEQRWQRGQGVARIGGKEG